MGKSRSSNLVNIMVGDMTYVLVPEKYFIKNMIVHVGEYGTNTFTHQRIYKVWIRYEISTTMIRDDLTHPNLSEPKH